MKVRRSETQIVRIVEEFVCVLKHRRFYVRWNDEVGGIFQSKEARPTIGQCCVRAIGARRQR